MWVLLLLLLGLLSPAWAVDKYYAQAGGGTACTELAPCNPPSSGGHSGLCPHR